MTAIRNIAALAIAALAAAPAATAGGPAAQAPARLLISEFVVTPTAGEMVEIYNPNSFPVDLTDVYITDATFAGGDVFYYQIVQGGGGGGSFGDWFARFPAGATIGPNEFQTLALNGSIGFTSTYGVPPTYEIIEDDPTPDAIPDMVEATPGSIPSSVGGSGLTNSGEFCVLFYWDGQSDLVVDLDYLVYGDKAEAVDKTGVSIDGPDADSDPSTYLPDTPIAKQDTTLGATGQPHAFGNSAQRLLLGEGIEKRTGGNGVDGNDETSENADDTWIEDLPTPNAPHADNLTIQLNPGAVGPNTLELRGATPNGTVFFFGNFSQGTILLPCLGDSIALDVSGIIVASGPADANGEVNAPVNIPSSVSGTLSIQALDVTKCRTTNLNDTKF